MDLHRKPVICVSNSAPSKTGPFSMSYSPVKNHYFWFLNVCITYEIGYSAYCAYAGVNFLGEISVRNLQKNLCKLNSNLRLVQIP